LKIISLSLETSEILRTATDSAFPEEISVAAFNRDVQKYAEQYGPNKAKIMENRLVLLKMGPGNFLTHIYHIMHLPDIGDQH